MNYNVKQFSRTSASGAFLFLSGLAIGALSTFLLDPQQGRRRRALIRDQALSKSRDFQDSSKKWTEDFKNRVYGTFAEAKSRMRNGKVDDYTLNQRVRAEFGRVVSHPKSVHSMVSNGVVTLRGVILAAEVDALIQCIKSVPGVQDVVNNLDVRKTAEGVPGLQGTGPQYLQ